MDAVERPVTESSLRHISLRDIPIRDDSLHDVSIPDISVTVVIPTTARRERASLLRRAIASVRDQQGIHARPLVVINGTHCAPEIESELRADPNIQLLVLAEGNLAGALRAGRALVETRWFATLDDDDVLLPDALLTRARVLEGNPDIDVVITNGIIRIDGVDTVHIDPELNVDTDPLRALIRRNWLLPGSWLARTDRVKTSLFDAMPRYRECTYLAIRFASDYRMHWLPKPTVVWHAQSPYSESRSREYLLGLVEPIQSLMTLNIPQDLRRSLRWQRAAALHGGADFLRLEGSVDAAWRMHWRSLFGYWGIRYIPFTRFLVLASMRKTLGRSETGKTP